MKVKLLPFVVCLFALVGGTSSFAQEKVETVDQTNQRIQDLATALKTQPGDYVLGSGDKVRIEVFDVPDLSRAVRISSSGYISLPLIPVRIRAAGLTPFQLEEKLVELLQSNQLVTNPHVSVFVEEHLSEPITVVGAVQKPVVFQAIRPVTLLEVLSQAGGIARDAGNKVLVTRPTRAEASAPGGGAEPAGPETITVDLDKLLESADPKANIPLYGGDIVTVPRAGIVYVVGAVNHAGGFVLQTDTADITTLKALALAGGLNGTAKPQDALIVRKTNGKNAEVSVDLKKILGHKKDDVRLYPNDILFIPDSAGKKALHRAGDVAIAVASGAAIVRVGR